MIASIANHVEYCCMRRPLKAVRYVCRESSNYALVLVSGKASSSQGDQRRRQRAAVVLTQRPPWTVQRRPRRTPPVPTGRYASSADLSSPCADICAYVWGLLTRGSAMWNQGNSWNEVRLRQRLSFGIRKCFAFTHTSSPGELRYVASLLRGMKSCRESFDTTP